MEERERQKETEEKTSQVQNGSMNRIDKKRIEMKQSESNCGATPRTLTHSHENVEEEE